MKSGRGCPGDVFCHNCWTHAEKHSICCSSQKTCCLLQVDAEANWSLIHNKECNRPHCSSFQQFSSIGISVAFKPPKRTWTRIFCTLSSTECEQVLKQCSLLLFWEYNWPCPNCNLSCTFDYVTNCVEILYLSISTNMWMSLFLFLWWLSLSMVEVPV